MSAYESRKPPSPRGVLDDDRRSEKSDAVNELLNARESALDPQSRLLAAGPATINEPPIITRNPGETERVLASRGMDLCRNPNIVRRTINDRPLDYEQRVCVRYLQPPPLPAPGPIIIEELRKPMLPPPPLVIREQPTVVETPPPIIIREQPPPRPIIPGPETKTKVVACDVVPERSVIIERYPAVQERPPNIIIERWLPYGPIPERETIIKRYGCNPDYAKPTCTIVNFDGPSARVVRKFAIVDVVNADPDDYVARYGRTLLDPRTTLDAVRRAGVTEDISSPQALSVRVYAERQTVDYRTSRSTDLDSFSSGRPSSAGIRTTKYDDRTGEFVSTA